MTEELLKEPKPPSKSKRKIIFKKLLFFNFKCHKNGMMDFSTNRFVLLTGDNGSGKSTYISALCWVLFDETDTGVKGDSVIRKKSGKDCSVLLQFSIDNDNYEIRKYRKHHKHNNDKILFKNGINISASTARETTSLVEEIIMPKDVFFNCMLFSQFINKSFINLSHTGQKEILDKLLGYDKYNEYKENLVIKLKEKEKELDKVKNAIVLNKASIDQIMDIISVEEEHSKEETEAYNNLINTNINRENELNITIKQIDIVTLESEIKNNAERLQNLSNDIKIIENKINTQRSNLKIELEHTEVFRKNNLETSKLQVIKKYENDISPINKSIEALESQKSKHINAKTRDINFTINRYSEKENELNKNYNNLKLDHVKTVTQFKLTSLNEEKNRLNTDLVNNIKELSKYEDPEKCPVCKNYIDIEIQNNMNKIKEDISIKIHDLKEDIAIKDFEINHFNGEYNKIVDRIENEKTNLINSITNIKKEKDIEIDKLEKKYIEIINDIETNIDRKKKEYIELENNKNLYINDMVKKDMEESSTIMKDIKNKHLSLASEWINSSKALKEEYNILEGLLQTQINNRTNYLKLLEELNIITHKRALYKDNYENNINKSNEKIYNLNKKKEEKELEIENNITEHSKLERTIKIYNFWKAAWSDSGIKSLLLDEALPILNRKSRELSCMCNNIRVQFDSQKSLTSGDFRNKFSINVNNTKNLSNLDELSAGETRLANIIVLLSLHFLLEESLNCYCNILLFDEILENLDPTNSSIAIDMIKELSKNYCVVLITHTLKDCIIADEEYKC